MEPIKPLKFSSPGPVILAPDELPIGCSGSTTAGQLGASVKAASKDARPPPVAKSSVSTAWLLGGEAKQEPLHLRFCPSLSWEDRVMGFIGCYVIGFTLSMTSMISFPALLAGHPGPFALKYSIGNVIGLLSTAFLVGLKTQLRSMTAPVRLGATIIYLLSILLTLVSALVFRIPGITLLAMLLQFCALLWYCASYIPFGRQCLRGCIDRVLRF